MNTNERTIRARHRRITRISPGRNPALFSINLLKNRLKIYLKESGPAILVKTGFLPCNIKSVACNSKITVSITCRQKGKPERSHICFFTLCRRTHNIGRSVSKKKRRACFSSRPTLLSPVSAAAELILSSGRKESYRHKCRSGAGWRWLRRRRRRGREPRYSRRS